MAVVWTKEMLEALSGPESSSEIALRFGLTKGVVSGKRFRLDRSGCVVRPDGRRTTLSSDAQRERDSAYRRELRAKKRREAGLPPGRPGRPRKAEEPVVVADATPDQPALVADATAATRPADSLYRMVPRPEKPRIVIAGRRECQWPMNDGRLVGGGRGWTFCCAAVEEGKPYCSLHCNIAYSRRVG